MLNLWSWLISHVGGVVVGIGVGIIGIVGFMGCGVIRKNLIDLRGKREGRRLTDEKNRLELKAQRKQFCVPLLTSIHEFAPVMAEFRKLHDDLWARQQLFWFRSRAKSYQQRLDALFATANERAAVAGSELSIDPAGRKVKDAFTAYLEAQRDYIQAITKPMHTFPNYFFDKADANALDELAKKADEQFTALEEAVSCYVESSPDIGQPSQKRLPGALSKARHLVQIPQRWRKHRTGSGQMKA